ncbi:hypothetical protein C0J52_19110 [Blattella germanica]|nr:hypothetical protein C0J52_19110 [Blattella germanica]
MKKYRAIDIVQCINKSVTKHNNLLRQLKGSRLLNRLHFYRYNVAIQVEDILKVEPKYYYTIVKETVQCSSMSIMSWSRKLHFVFAMDIIIRYQSNKAFMKEKLQKAIEKNDIRTSKFWSYSAKFYKQQNNLDYFKLAHLCIALLIEIIPIENILKLNVLLTLGQAIPAKGMSNGPLRQMASPARREFQHNVNCKRDHACGLVDNVIDSSVASQYNVVYKTFPNICQHFMKPCRSRPHDGWEVYRQAAALQRQRCSMGDDITVSGLHSKSTLLRVRLNYVRALRALSSIHVLFKEGRLDSPVWKDSDENDGEGGFYVGLCSDSWHSVTRLDVFEEIAYAYYTNGGVHQPSVNQS